MKRLVKILLASVVTVMAMGVLQGCDKESGGLKGWYATNTESVNVNKSYIGDCCSAYEFKNGNTVNYYGAIYTYINTNKVNKYDFISVDVNGQTWYSYDKPQTYTYVYEDNTIVIPSQGVILMKDGKKLVQDNSSKVYYKK